jgi:hypothetical protein
VNSKTKDAWSERFNGFWNNQLRMCEQKEVTKCGSKVSTVNIGLFRRSWMVHFMASCAENLNRKLTGNVRKTNGENWLALTERARAATEINIHIFIILKVQLVRKNNSKIMNNCLTILCIPADVNINLA